MNRLKIIWITSSFPSGNDTTNGIYLYRTVKILSKDYDINTICLFPAFPPILKMLQRPFIAKKTYNHWKKNFPINPLPPPGLDHSSIYYIRYWRLPRSFFNHLEGYFAYFMTKRIVKNLITEETVLHSNWMFPSGQLARIISRKYQIPYIVSLLGTDVHKLKFNTSYWRAAQKIIDDAKIVCSVSHQLIEKCKKEKMHFTKNKIQFIDNIYDENTFTILDRNSMREILNLSHNKKFVLFAGGLIDIKNVATLISAFSELSKHNVNCDLLIAGSGINENYLKSLVKRLKINKYVHFMGNLLEKDLVNYMNAVDVFCLPSINEGTPNVIVESLLCGTPVAASNVGGIPEIVSPGINGYLFEPSSVQDISKKLEDALNKNWDRNLIRQSAKRFFTAEVVKKYHALYQELTN